MCSGVFCAFPEEVYPSNVYIFYIEKFDFENLQHKNKTLQNLDILIFHINYRLCEKRLYTKVIDYLSHCHITFFYRTNSFLTGKPVLTRKNSTTPSLSFPADKLFFL